MRTVYMSETVHRRPSNKGLRGKLHNANLQLSVDLVLPVPGVGLSGPVLGRLGPQSQCERIKIRSQIARAGGPGKLGVRTSFRASP